MNSVTRSFYLSSCLVACAAFCACTDYKPGTVRCTSDADCPEGMDCDVDVCRPTCITSDDCEGELFCISGYCLQPCQSDDDCPKDTHCEGGYCQPDEPENCEPGDPPLSCGVDGSGCRHVCQPDGRWGPCEGPEGPVDTVSDPANCGECGLVCPEPMHAEVRCESGLCARGPCEAGWYDLEGNPGWGCRWQCESGVCTDVAGFTVAVTNDPLPETGAVFQALASGSSYGAAVQTSRGYINAGVLGEPTWPCSGGEVEQTSSQYRNVGGLKAAGPP